MQHSEHPDVSKRRLRLSVCQRDPVEFRHLKDEAQSCRVTLAFMIRDSFYITSTRLCPLCCESAIQSVNWCFNKAPFIRHYNSNTPRHKRTWLLNAMGDDTLIGVLRPKHTHDPHTPNPFESVTIFSAIKLADWRPQTQLRHVLHSVCLDH